MTILEALKSVSNYPVPARTLTRIAAGRDLNLSTEITKDILGSREYQYAEADVMMWLSKAPTISEAGVTFTFSQTERDRFRREAASIFAELGETRRTPYGYKGDTL